MSNLHLGQLEECIDKALVDFNIPGAAIVVVSRDDVVYGKGHGVKESGGSDRIDEHTLFQIGSTSKAFTTAALGILVDEGRIGWDEPVLKRLPGFQLHDPWLTCQLTIRDTVTHSSGFIDSIAHVLEIMDTKEAVRRMRYRECFAPFRASYCYSNLMYGVAGQVIEAASGQTWHEFIQTRLLEPLGMKRSGTSPRQYWDAQYIAPTSFGTAPAGRVRRADARDSNIAMPHFHQQGQARMLPWQSYDTAAAAGSVVSSAADLSNWLQLHLNAGAYKGKRILRKETLSEMHRAQNLYDKSVFPFETNAGAHAMGWRRERYRGETHLSHTGLILGFPAQLSLLPDQGLGIAVLANGQAATFERCERGDDPFAFHKSIALWIFDRSIGGPATDWSALFLQRISQAHKTHGEQESALQASRLSQVAPTLRLKDYEGEYRDRSAVYGQIEVVGDADGLQLRFAGEGAYSAKLSHWHQELFRLVSCGAPWIDSFVSFAIDAPGKVAALRVFDVAFERV
jgi:CubicO group peptidase (beta-lactamase class C family)